MKSIKHYVLTWLGVDHIYKLIDTTNADVAQTKDDLNQLKAAVDQLLEAQYRNEAQANHANTGKTANQ